MDWLLMRPTCNLETVKATWEFARRFEAPIYVKLIHYSLPYFTKGQETELQFNVFERPNIELVVNEILRLQAEFPRMFLNSRPRPDVLRDVQAGQPAREALVRDAVHAGTQKGGPQLRVPELSELSL